MKSATPPVGSGSKFDRRSDDGGPALVAPKGAAVQSHAMNVDVRNGGHFRDLGAVRIDAVEAGPAPVHAGPHRLAHALAPIDRHPMTACSGRTHQRAS
jgi:hypothetical protein